MGLHPERAGVIVAGTLIFETVLALSGLDRMIVSEHDLLYGILLETYHDLREYDGHRRGMLLVAKDTREGGVSERHRRRT